jgi:putative transcriptional regulator
MAVSDKDFETIMAGLAEVGAILNGEADPATYRVHVPDEVDVRAIRKRLGMTQAQFAARFGFSKGAVTDWEQKRRRPEASARVLLTVIDREPEAVLRALAAG